MTHHRNSPSLFLLFCLLITPGLLLGADRAIQAFPEKAPGVFDKGAYLQKQAELHAWLVRNQVSAALPRPIVVTLSAEDWRAITKESARERRIRVGVEKKIDASVNFKDLDLRRPSATAMIRPHGAFKAMTGGGFVWTGVIRSAGATALRVELSQLALPAGAELYVYNRAGEAHGPYSGKGPLGTGNFWSHTVSGEELIVQLHQRNSTGRAPNFQIKSAGVIGPQFQLFGAKAQAANELCPYNASCVVNASCQSSTAVSTARDAVALILFQSGGFLYICSGGLLADTDSSSQIPYFLTANHCISRGREAASMETFFQFTTSCGTCNDSTGQSHTLGSSIVSSSKTSDYTLLRLNEPPPAGSAFLGWTSTPVAFSNNTALFRISHPQGAPQGYSVHSVDTSKTTCGSWPRGNWIYSEDTLGATEGGSSGSPVVNSSGQVVGQLSGACGFNVNDNCDAESNATVDGAFAAYFSNVEQFLNPDGGGGGPGCAPVGDACTSNSQCCSNKCKGKPGSQTCRS